MSSSTSPSSTGSTAPASRPLAVVTGASSGIGFEMARCMAQRGHDLVVAADTPLASAVAKLRALGAQGIEPVQADLATGAGVQALWAAVAGRPVAALLANAGEGVGGAFLQQDLARVRHVIDTNITGTLRLVQLAARQMVARRAGRILVTGSIVGYAPGPFNAAYNASKAFIDSFVHALQNELQGTGVSLTLLMPGLTASNFFERADMLDTRIAADLPKDDPAEVARAAVEAMARGDASIVPGWHNRAQLAALQAMPARAAAELHRLIAQPGSGSHRATQADGVRPLH